jgi:hypothetical protein
LLDKQQMIFHSKPGEGKTSPFFLTMSKNKALQIWVNERLDYNIIENEDKISLVRTNNGDWVNPGENACTFIDHGNVVVINIGYQSLSLDYCEVLELLILLLHTNDSKIQFVESKIIKTI